MTKPFTELGLSEKLIAAVGRLGYENPTPVQEQAIPAVLAGRDVIAAAKTGTGKTAAFSLPSLDRIGHAQRSQGPLMLVVTPTRELAAQIAEVCEVISQETHHRVVTVVGGVSYDPQIKKIKSGVDVLIATPGRLIDLMEREAVNLGNVEVLVLDEADRMLDMGFLPPMKKIIAATPKSRQTLLFSATIDRVIMKNVGYLLKDPVFVEIAHRGETADTVDQYIIRTEHLRKPELLKAVLEEKGSFRVIVFARTRGRADTCCRRLKRAGYPAEAIHSDRSQAQRRRALENFASGKTGILVATDVLARGIDVSEVEYVVNFDLPEQAEDYVHRIGRTGRAGQAGFAISFVTPETKGLLKDIQKLIGKEIPELTLENYDEEAAARAAEERAERGKARAEARREAQRDPELAKAAAEYRKEEQRKKERAAHRAEEAQQREGGKRPGKNKQRKQRNAAALAKVTGNGGGRPARSSKGQRSAKAAKAAKTSKLERAEARELGRGTGRNGAVKGPKAASKKRSAKSVKAAREAAQARTAPAKKGDFRPGRAHRAAMASKGNRSAR